MAEFIVTLGANTLICTLDGDAIQGRGSGDDTFVLRSTQMSGDVILDSSEDGGGGERIGFEGFGGGATVVDAGGAV